jgi:hypothetical protein
MTLLRARFLAASLAVAAVAGTCAPAQPISLVPADYRAHFTATRNCRGTTDHINPLGVPTNIMAIVVYVNPESAAAYDANTNPLPAGTLVIKEEHDDPNCNHVYAWSVARKEPGFDPAHGDWHWQHVLADGTVEADGRVDRCSSCHSACTSRDWMCTQ